MFVLIFEICFTYDDQINVIVCFVCTYIYLMTFQIYVPLKVAAVMAASLITLYIYYIHFISYIMFVK